MMPRAVKSLASFSVKFHIVTILTCELFLALNLRTIRTASEIFESLTKWKNYHKFHRTSRWLASILHVNPYLNGWQSTSSKRNNWSSWGAGRPVYRYFPPFLSHPAWRVHLLVYSVTSARQTNYDTLIDYVFADVELVGKEFIDCEIRADIEGSGHRPVVATWRTRFGLPPEGGGNLIYKVYKKRSIQPNHTTSNGTVRLVCRQISLRNSRTRRHLNVNRAKLFASFFFFNSFIKQKYVTLQYLQLCT